MDHFEKSLACSFFSKSWEVTNPCFLFWVGPTSHIASHNVIWGALPGAATTAPAQHISSVVAVERLISEIGAALEQRGAEPCALRRVRERIRAREINATLKGH